ncbi:MAG: hypothetical protein D6773_05970, partial [Alphaproteobacteria bacterium]
MNARPDDRGEARPAAAGDRLWIERLALTRYRNYAHLALELDPRPVVLTGANGAGKTNLMEAVTLLAPGRGMRRAVYADLVQHGAQDAEQGAP